MQKAEDILRNLGLTNNEIRVFLSSLRLGLAPVSRVAAESKITRTYAYELVEALKEKGLLAEVEERGVRKVKAVDHVGLLAYLGRKQRDMERLEKDLVRSAGTFHAIQSKMPEKTKVRFFEGVEGIKSINSEIRRDLQKLKQPHKFYVVFSADRMEAVLPGWIEHNEHIYYEPHMRKYAIVSETPLLRKFLDTAEKNRQKNFSHKLWPRDKQEFPTDTLCWQNKIAYLDMQGHPSGIVIENEAIASTFRMWFEAMWNSLR